METNRRQHSRQPQIFRSIRETIDAYFRGRAFEVTVVAARMSGTVAHPLELNEPLLREEIEIHSGDIEAIEAAIPDPDAEDDLDMELEAFVANTDRREMPTHY